MENMSKRAVITIRLIPEASKLSDEELINKIEKEIKKTIYTVPWANNVESIKIKEN